MTDNNIHIGGNEYDAMYVGSDEIGFGFVGDIQFFGMDIETSYYPSFATTSQYSLNGVVSLTTPPDDLHLSCTWYYNTSMSIDGATQIEGITGTSITVTSDYAGKYLVCVVSCTRDYYYGTKTFDPIYSDLIKDNRTKRTITYSLIGTSSITIGTSDQKAYITISPTTGVSVSDIKIIGAPEGFASVSYGRRYVLTINASSVSIGEYKFHLFIEGNDTYTDATSSDITINVIGSDIENPVVSLSTTATYGSQVYCTATCDTEDVNKTYIWYANGNKIESATTYSITIDDTTLIGQTLSCDVVFSKANYKSVTVSSDTVLVQKGTRTLSIDGSGLTDATLYVMGNQVKTIPYVENPTGGTLVISNKSSIYYTITDNSTEGTMSIQGYNQQMENKQVISIYVEADSQYLQSNTVKFYLQTLQGAWDNVYFQLSGEPKVDNILTIEMTNSSEYTYTVSDQKWYLIDDLSQTEDQWTKISNDGEMTVELIDGYQGKYIGCMFDVTEDKTGDKKSFIYYSTEIYDDFDLIIGDISGNLNYGQQLTANYSLE